MPSLMEVSKQELATALNERDQLLALMRDISSSMERIKELEHVLTMSASQSDEPSSARRSQIIADIASVQSTLKQRREQLQDLEAKLKKSSMFNDELQGSINALNSMIDAQSKEINMLRQQLMIANEQIGSLNNVVDSLSMTVAETESAKDSVMAASTRLENELNTCYYVVATKDELKRHRIIESGFLRRTRFLHSDFDKDVFSVCDKRTLSEIPVVNKKVRIYTHHPDASYVIDDSGDESTLKILDPEQFWSVSNYLVIQTD